MIEHLLRWVEAAASRPHTTVLIAASVTVALVVLAATRLHVDNEIDAWLPHGDDSLADYRRFRTTFGSDAFFVVGCVGVAFDEELDRLALAEFQARLAGLASIDHVVGPFAEDGHSVSSAAPFLVGSDRRAAAILVYPYPGLEPAAREELFESIESLRARAPGKLLVAGPEAINHYLDVGSRASFGSLFPVVAVVVALVLFGVLRDLGSVAAVLLLASASSAWTLAALALTGRSMNMLVSSLPALLLVLGTATSLHVLDARARLLPDASTVAAWRAAAADTLRPCLFSAMTTSIGLGALVLAPLPPLRDLGIFGALGVVINFGLVFLLLPALTTVLHGGSARSGDAGRPWSGGQFIMRLLKRPLWRRTILVGAVGGVLASGLGIARLRIESDILSFFASDHPLLTSTRTIEERLIGLTPIEIWFSGPPGEVLAPRALANAMQLAAGVQAEPAVSGIFGPSSPSATPAQWPDHLRLSDDRADVRWTVTTRTTSIEESERLVQRIEALVEESKPAGVEVLVTGAMPILIRMQALLLVSMLRSFGTSIGLVTLMLAIAFRSLRAGLMSLVPNVLPVFATLGLMGFFGVPLDVATVTVASIALGIVVDDTIHLLDRYLSKGRTLGALQAALQHAGRPILFSSLAVAAGFMAFTAAPFRPTFHFGVLVATTSLFALACDLLVLPALLATRLRCS